MPLRCPSHASASVFCQYPSHALAHVVAYAPLVPLQVALPCPLEVLQLVPFLKVPSMPMLVPLPVPKLVTLLVVPLHVRRG